jgi:hypothetical protein
LVSSISQTVLIYAITEPEPGELWADMLLLVGIFVLLVWPWIFLGVVWALNGVQMNSHVAKVVRDNPHATTFFITLFGNIVSTMVSIFFSFSITRFAQERSTAKDEKAITLFEISILSAFRYQHWPWGINDLRSVLDRTRWLFMVLVVGCIATFAFVLSSTTSLITPAPFNRTATVTGNELNFSSSAADCLEWFNANRIPNNCDWKVSWMGP